MELATALAAPTTSTAINAQQLADEYLARILDTNYRAVNGFFGNGYWYFLIRYQNTAHELISTGAKLVIDTQTQSVIPLTGEQIQDLFEAPTVSMAQAQGTLARDEQGCVLRYQAKRIATAYLREQLSMHYSATGGMLVPLRRTVWQFSIRFHMPRIGELMPLGLIDVDTQCGEVIPLRNPQLQQLRQRVDAIIKHRELASAA